MRLKRIVLVNRAPFDNLDLDFSGKLIISLTGINGAGKTTILSYIVDAFYEMARKAYTNEFSGEKEGKYYRISSPLFNITFYQSSLTYICFEHNGEEIKYIDYLGKNDEETYNKIALQIENCVPYSVLKSHFGSSNNVKYLSYSKEKIEEIFSSGIQTYFPAYRYEQPGYLNDIYKVRLDFKKTTSFSGYLTNPIEVTSDLPGIANWIMDIVLDKELYQNVDEFGFVNRIISNILICKSNKSVRLGIGQRHLGGARIQIVENETSRQLYPSIFNISSGEASLLCIFAELLKQIDEIRKSSNDVEGIVLIDEIDKHLHIKLQKEVLPNLMKEFPNLQFVFSTHSAFVNLGISDLYGNNSVIFDLDRGGIESEVDQNGVFREAYDTIINENQRYIEKYKLLQNQLDVVSKPLIITEGPTDWRHMKAAREALMAHPDCADWLPTLQFEFLEYDPENSKSERDLKITMSDSELVDMCKCFSKYNNPRKLIFISDRDNPKATKDLNVEGSYKNWGRNVYSCWIPVPEQRKESQEICIEHYYPDEQIKQEVVYDNSLNRRLFMGNEFNKHGFNSSKNLFCQNINLCGPSKINIIDGNDKNKVFFIDDEEEHNLALPKMEFAKRVLNKIAPFDNMDFTGFIPLFKLIREILETN